MKVKDLKNLLNSMNDNAEVYVEELDDYSGEVELKPAFAGKCVVHTYVEKGKTHRTIFLGDGKIDEAHVEALRIF